jgi:integrase/recombinase XerD
MKTLAVTQGNQPRNIDNVIENFLFHCRYEKNLSDKTINAYNTDLGQFSEFIENLTGCKDMYSILKENLKAYLQNISHFQPKTVKRKMASLKALFNHMEYENNDFINPFHKMKIRLKEPQTLPVVMTIDEVKKILLLLNKERKENRGSEKYLYKTQTRNLAVIELLFATGIRVSELCNLKESDVNLKQGIIKVFGKGSKERIIQICHPETLSILKSCYSLYKKQIQNNGAFFVNRLNAPLSAQSVRLMIKNCVKKARLTKVITPHTFRHTFATLLLEEDVDIKYIQSMLGHSSVATTQIYTHVSSGKQKKILSNKHPRRKLTLDGNE